MTKKFRRMSERDLTKQVAEYLQLRKIPYWFTLSADIKLTIGQAVRNKAINGPMKGFPDLLVFRPNGNTIFIELKIARNEVFTRSGKLRQSQHIKQQIQIHKLLNSLGFKTFFAFSLEDVIFILSDTKNI